MSNVNKMVFIIGPARSGTTMLGRILSNLNNSIYLEEPTGVWLPLFSKELSDEIGVNCYSSNDIARIRKWFLSKSKKSNSIIIEKSPSNSMRPDVVRMVFPEAYIIYLTRSVGKIANSSLKQWKFMSAPKALENGGIYLGILISRVRKFLRLSITQKINFLYRILLLPRTETWGPRYKGIDQDLQGMPVEEICYKQASVSLEKVTSAYFSDKGRCIMLEYESIIEQPDVALSNILNFIEYRIDQEELALFASKVSVHGG